MISGPRHLDVRDSANLTRMADRWLSKLIDLDLEAIIVNGAAAGMDTCIDTEAKAALIPTDQLPVDKADWEGIGRSAGHKRNAVMLLGGEWHGKQYPPADRFVSFWNGLSRGTRGATELGYRNNKLTTLYFSNGVVWQPTMRWNPIEYGDNYQMVGLAHWTECLERRLWKNINSPGLRKTDGSIDWIKFDYANARAEDACKWLKDGNLPWDELDRSSPHYGWYAFPSKSRAKSNITHHTRPDAKACTCEGWEVTKVGKRVEDGRSPCIHMHIAWLWRERARFIEDVYTTADVYTPEEYLEVMGME
jgi:hypothetical protein